MKKIISLLLCAAMLLCLPACKDTDEPAPSTTGASAATAETTLPEETMPQVALPQIPVAAVTLTPTREVEVLPDGTVLFEYNYPTISLSLPDGDTAETVMLDFLNRIDATRPEAQQVKEAAEEFYTGKSGWNTYFYNMTYSPMRIDTGVLSLYGLESSFSGGMHPNHNACAVNYDLTTGKVLKLRDILTPEVTADTLTTLLCNALAQQADMLFSDYALCVEDRFAGDFGADDQWYLSDTGLCFFFSPYEIAPYNAGTIVAEIPYDRLAGVLQDGFFPGETVSNRGDLYARYFDDLSEEQLNYYTRFAEVTLHSEGTAIVLETDEIVYNLSIQLGKWNDDRTQFTPYSTVFSTNCLTRADAVVLKINQDAMSELCIRYLSADTVCHRYPEDQDGMLAMVSNTAKHGAAD